jgi:hypothetical protein
MCLLFNLRSRFSVVLTRISFVFEELITRPTFLDSSQRSSNFLCIFSNLWNIRHTLAAYSMSSSNSSNLYVILLFFPPKALRSIPSRNNRNIKGDRKCPCRTPADVRNNVRPLNGGLKCRWRFFSSVHESYTHASTNKHTHTHTRARACVQYTVYLYI